MVKPRKGINYKDRFIAVRDDNNNLSFSHVYSYSGYITFRLKNVKQEHLDLLKTKCEYHHESHVCSISLPPNTNIEQIKQLLIQGVQKGLWECKDLPFSTR